MTVRLATWRRLLVRRGGVIACALVVLPAAACAQSDDARDLLRSGKYAEAATAFAKVPASDSGWVAAQRGLARALISVGRYDDAENAARRAAAAPRGKELANALGEVLYARGKIAEAEQAFTRAMGEHASDSLTAAVNLAVLHYERGDRDRAMAEFDRFIDVYNENSAPGGLNASELTAVAIACRYLGTTNPQLFKDALKAFDRAIDEAGNTAEGDDARVRLGELFLEKYNSSDAQSTFDEVLRANPSHPRALLGAARRRFFDNLPGADSLVERALKVNGAYPDAHVFRAELHLDLEEYREAEREADRALQVNPAHGDALAVKAAARYLVGDRAGFEAAKTRALAANPKNAELYNTVAELAARVRQYREAAELSQQAVALDAKSWRAFGLLGMNQLRLGNVPEGRKSLETSFAGDPYNVWIKNTLDLLDTFKNYDETKTDHFVFMVEKDESALLQPYLAELSEAAYRRFATKYAYTPPPPIRIEVYRSHADFSVRTVGLAGIGALGVSFGTTLAFDSPAATDAGPFNWGSTVWHELAHTFTLGATNHRIPRWLSEGLSVYEERRARPGWGFDVTPGFLDAYSKKKLVPVSRMNDGFMHPAYPEQVMFSYYQASLVCELIARDFGEPALVRMLEGYKNGQTTEQVFQNVLKSDLASFDRKFDGYMRERFGAVQGNLEEFKAKLGQGQALAKAGRTDEAIAALERAKALFPQYTGDDGPAWHLAMIYKGKGDLRRAADELKSLVSVSEISYKAHLELADVLEKLGDHKGAADALDGAMYINPFELPVHQRLAELSRLAGDKQKVVRERRAIVALAPVDRAEALYQLALAYREAGDAASARKTILLALEDAPNFEKAQTLLLTIHGDGRKP